MTFDPAFKSINPEYNNLLSAPFPASPVPNADVITSFSPIMLPTLSKTALVPFFANGMSVINELSAISQFVPPDNLSKFDFLFPKR